MGKPVIHIGANKTASTTLQRALFRHHSGLYYMGEDGEAYSGYNSIVNAMVNDDDLHFPELRCRDLFQSGLVRAEAQDKTFLYSNEDVMTSRIPALCAKRLKSFIPEAKVLLVIRNQHTALPSFYANHGAFLKPAPPSYFRRYVSFDDWMSFQTQPMFIKYGALASYYYHRLLSVYADLFGENNVHVLMFEEFVENKQTFVGKLCDILEVDVGEATRLLGGRHERQRITARMLAYNRFRTSFFWGVRFCDYLPGGQWVANAFTSYLESGASAKVDVPDAWRMKIIDLYGEDNSTLAKKYGLPLEKYGYPII